MKHKIFDYTSNSLNESEKERFNQLLKEDVQLKEDVALVYEVDAAILDAEKASLRKKLAFIAASDAKATPKPVSSSKLILTRTVLVAASLIFVLAIGGVLLMLNTKQFTADELYSQYYEVYTPDVVNRSAENQGHAISPGLEAYLDGDYETALSLFNESVQTKNDASLELFYGALASLETSDFPMAIEWFATITDQEIYPYFYHAQWYLALTYLKTNDLTNAKKQLSSIVANNRYYKDRATELIEKIPFN